MVQQLLSFSHRERVTENSKEFPLFQSRRVDSLIDINLCTSYIRDVAPRHLQVATFSLRSINVY